MNEQTVLTVDQLAKRWQVSYNNIRTRILTGEIPALKVTGTAMRISLDVIRALETEPLNEPLTAFERKQLTEEIEDLKQQLKEKNEVIDEIQKLVIQAKIN